MRYDDDLATWLNDVRRQADEVCHVMHVMKLEVTRLALRDLHDMHDMRMRRNAKGRMGFVRRSTGRLHVILSVPAWSPKIHP